MNTMTMANALKAVFGAQTLTTASYFPACAQDGTPSGVISAANLASVLGVGHKGSGITLNAGGELEIPNTTKSYLVGIQSSSDYNWSFGVYGNGTTAQPFVTAPYSQIGNQNEKICIVRKVENQNLFIVNNIDREQSCVYFYMELS